MKQLREILSEMRFKQICNEWSATFLEKVGDNDYRAEYQDKVCTAIFNPFVGCYYVDDVYGVVSERRLCYAT